MRTGKPLTREAVGLMPTARILKPKLVRKMTYQTSRPKMMARRTPKCAGPMSMRCADLGIAGVCGRPWSE